MQKDSILRQSLNELLNILKASVYCIASPQCSTMSIAAYAIKEIKWIEFQK